MRLLALATAASLLAGCYETGALGRSAFGGYIEITRPVVGAKTEIVRDDYKRALKVSGPFVNARGHRWMVRGWRDADSADWSYQIYVSATLAGDWADFNAAWSDGTQFPVTRIDSSIGYCGGGNGCTLYETIGVDLSAEQVAQFARTGLNYKVTGPGAEFVSIVPAAYFQGVLDAVNAHDGVKTSASSVH